MSRRHAISLLARYFVLVVLAAIFILPFYWMLVTSLKPVNEVFLVPVRWVPKHFAWDNYVIALTNFPFFQYLKNTLLIVALNVTAAILVNPFIAFSFSLLRWRFREPVFLVVLSTIMLPPQVLIIPLFVIFRNLGWLNTYLPLTVPPFFGNAIFIFLLRQFMKKLPFDLLEASRMDGCNNYRLYWSVIFPLVRTPLAAIAVFQFLWSWNDFFMPLIYINDTSRKTLSLGLMDFLAQASSGGFVNWGALMAGAFLALIPCVAVFAFSQRYLATGISLLGVNR